MKYNPTKDLKFVIRASDKTVDKIRLIIVGMHVCNKKDKVLANVYRLHSNRDMAWIHIIPDLTKKQRRKKTALVRRWKNKTISQ